MSEKAGLSAQKIELFENTPIPKAVCRLAIPTIISQLISMIYNLADTYFVGQLNDPNQVAAVSISFPAVMMITALTNFFGIGGSGLFSRYLGTREYGKARNVSSFCFYTSIAVCALYCAAALIFIDPLLTLLGASSATMGFAKTYAVWVVVIGGIPSMLSMLLGNLIRAEGASRQASIGMSLGGILNIILDPIFILPWGLNLGLAGAAIATVLSNCMSVVYFLIYLHTNKDCVVSIKPSDFSSKGVLSPVAKNGIPAFIQSLLPIISNTILNNMAVSYDDCAVAAIGIVKKVDIFAMNVTMGMSQGILPLLAYSYSSGRYKRMFAARRFALTASIAFCAICIVVFELFPSHAISLFIKDAKTVAYGASFLRIQCLATPFMAINFSTVSTFQAVGTPKQAMAVTLVRKGILDAPMYLLMDFIFPLVGLMCVQPIMDFISSMVSVALMARFRKKLMKE